MLAVIIDVVIRIVVPIIAFGVVFQWWERRKEDKWSRPE